MFNDVYDIIEDEQEESSQNTQVNIYEYLVKGFILGVGFSTACIVMVSLYTYVVYAITIFRIKGGI